MNLRLQQILEERKNKLSIISPAIKDIHDRTVRAVKNKVAGEKEFVNKVVSIIQKEVCIMYTILMIKELII